MVNLPIPPLPFLSVQTIGIPVGTVVTFAGELTSSSSSPLANMAVIEEQGWTLCDGRTLLISQYPELFTVLGYLYGGDKSQFKIPDYRGIFLRGVDDREANNDEGKDPDRPRKVGSAQEDALQKHQHSYNQVPNPSGTTIVANTGEGTPANEATNLTGEPTDSLLSSPGKVRSSEETRPKNITVYYIIKYTSK
jgi:microcystin-dependent protein